ncbi:MAG: DUF853 family protein, partial [Clostridia bacterium]|nr:DUF853 family protein [Clostridia bacterium]
LLQKIEQVVRLIRSKGVSVWFISQNPSDIPETVLSQISNRVQHALRAYTPNEQKALRYAARSFRENPSFDTETVLQELEVGQALVSVLDLKGVPSVVERANILPPRSSMQIAPEDEVAALIRQSPLGRKYDEAVDRESAYEMLSAQLEQEQQALAEAQEQKIREAEEKKKEKERLAAEKAKAKKATSRKNSVLGKTVNSAASSIGREIGRNLIRGLFGTLKR